MNPIQRTLEYLRNRDTRNHRGAMFLLKNVHWESKSEQIIANAIQIMQMEFIKTAITPSGICKLTALSTKIGEMAAAQLGIYDRVAKEGSSEWQDHIKMGDLILEAFLQCEYIIIEYTHYDPEEVMYCYIVKWSKTWPGINEIPITYFIRGSSKDKPKPIDNLYDPITGRRRIKNIYSEKLFTKLLNKPFIKAGSKLEATGWKVNNRVLQSILKNKPKFNLENPSKATEYDFITRKAKHLSEWDEFYQHIDYDYRGRIYYTESFFNFQGSDLARGIMLFSKGQKLTQEGMWWLAVHTASSYNKSYSIDNLPKWLEGDYKSYLKSEGLKSISVDKMTLEDRVRWTNNNMDLIIECARRNRLCLTCEKPISFLACCIEWESINNNPDHVCHLPLPIDGSNNGWQHLGAISKDTHTGKLVGLVPVDIQADFYVQTAKELIKLVPDWFKERKDMKMKHIRKGISKRGSMTRAYSAGADKIAINMYEDCKKEGYHDMFNITREDCKILAKNLISAINTVCPGPLQTMKFLQKIATKKLEETNQLFWWTPSGFPVIYQSFQKFKMKTRSILKGIGSNSKSQVKHTHLVIRRKQEDNKPIADKQKYASGISPNFIHSMDASHMALVIYDWDHDFGAVHDSFSTHPNHVEDLLQLTKQRFVKMYNHDNYFDKIERTFKVTMPEQPSLGELNIMEVYDSDYFFA